MSDIIYPRSPRLKPCAAGCICLCRYIDKIRLHLAGKLHPDYQANLGKGFDGKWLEVAGVDEKQFVEVVRNSITDGQVCDWVFKNVKKPDSVKAALRDGMLDYPRKDDAATQERLKTSASNNPIFLSEKSDIQCFVDYIDADEKKEFRTHLINRKQRAHSLFMRWVHKLGVNYIQ